MTPPVAVSECVILPTVVSPPAELNKRVEFYPPTDFYQLSADFPLEEFSVMLAGAGASQYQRPTLSDLYPQEFRSDSIATFADLLRAASSFLHADPVLLSIQEAARRVSTGTAVRINPSRIASDAARMQAIGLPALVAERSAAIRHRTYQPTARWPEAPYAGALPTDIDNLASLVRGAPVLLPPGFRPNQGINCRLPDPALALSVELHFADDHAKGLGLIIPLDDALASAAAAAFDIHISPILIVRKVGKPLGRLCFDYTAGSLNSDDKREILAATWGPYNLPQVLQWCCAWESARVAFPNDTLNVYATDYESWYKRILNALEAVGLFATSFLINDVPHLFLPLVEQFGSQDSGYHSNLGSRLLYAHMSARHEVLWQAIVAHQYSDDIMGFLPPALIDAEVEKIDSDAETLAGEGALARIKTRKGPTVDGNGWSWCGPDGTFTLTYSILLRMICVLFLELPQSVSAGDPCPIITLQRLSAYCLRACVAMPSMQSFSRGASHNVARYASARCQPLLLPQTVIDIHAWRAAFQLAFANDASWLMTPTFVPILLSPLNSNESTHSRQLRQASAARFITHADACTTYSGTGFVLSHGTGEPNIDGKATDPFAWGFADFPDLAPFLAAAVASIPATKHSNKADINLLEMIGAVTAILAIERLIVSASPLIQPDGRHRGLVHVHTWTDNTSALSWLISHRSQHPVHSFLLQTLSFAMQRSRLLLTFGHVPGVINITADAISRHFLVPAGPAVRARLTSATLCPASKSFTASLMAVSRSASSTPFDSLRAALTGLV